MSIEPIRGRERWAAEFLGVSTSYLRAQRLRDKELVAAGKAPEGPPWVQIGRPVFYYRDELTAWADQRRKSGIRCGTPDNPGGAALQRHNEQRQAR